MIVIFLGFFQGFMRLLVILRRKRFLTPFLLPGRYPMAAVAVGTDAGDFDPAALDFLLGLPALFQPRGAEIVLDGKKLESLGLRPVDVEARIRELSTLRAPGSLVLSGRQVTLAVRTRVERVSELEELVLLQRPEGPVRLRDVGTVRETTPNATLSCPHETFRASQLPQQMT